MVFVDPYIDENTGLIKNLLGTTSTEERAEIEPQIVFAMDLSALEEMFKGIVAPLNQD